MPLSESTMAVVMEALEHYKEWIADLDSMAFYEDASGKEKITECQTAITELQAAQAGEWRPVGDGEVSSFMYVDNGGKLLGVYAGNEYSDWYATEDLPNHIRLCEYIGSQEGRNE